MGYRFTILRTQDKKIIPITIGEVIKFTKLLPEWKFDEEKKALISTYGDEYPLQLSEGQLWTEDPDLAAIDEMISIAEHFDARLRDEELWTYGLNGQFLHPDDVEEQAILQTEVRQKSQISFFHSKLFFVLSFILLIVAYKSF